MGNPEVGNPEGNRLKFSNMSENISQSPPFPACAIIFFAKHMYVCSDLEVKGICRDLDI